MLRNTKSRILALFFGIISIFAVIVNYLIKADSVFLTRQDDRISSQRLRISERIEMTPETYEAIIKYDIKSPFRLVSESFIKEIDTTKLLLESVGCSQGYFGLVSSEYVIKIPEKIYKNSKDYEEYNVGEKDFNCELLIFDSRKANLANICTDLIFMNTPEPVRRIKSSEGKINVILGQPKELKGTGEYNVFIEIQSLKFIDAENHNEIIEINDKLLWNVKHLGVPG